jgi:multiple sugar transport system substrate-binding protein
VNPHPEFVFLDFCSRRFFTIFSESAFKIQALFHFPTEEPMKTRTLIAFGVAAVAVGSLVAAQSGMKKISIAAFPSLDEAVKIALPGLKKKFPNYEIELVALQYGDHHQALTTALATGQGLHDIEAVEIGFVGKFAEGGGLEDLNKAPYNAKSLRPLFVDYTVAQATSSDGRFVGIPTDIGPGTTFYRKDILDKAGVSVADLGTWEGYIAAGKKIQAVDKKVFLINSAASAANLIIRSNIPAGQGIYFDKDNKVLVGPDNARWVKAFTVAKQIRDAKLDAKIGEWSNEWYEGFKGGTVATQFSGAWLQGHFQNWMAPETKGLWRVADLPDGAYAPWGGSFYTIPNASKNKKEAWDVIKYLTTDRAQQIAAFKGNGAFPALKAAWSDASFNEAVPFLGGQKARLLWKAAAQKIKPLDVNKYDSVADTIVQTQLTAVLDEGKDIKAALSEARAEIEKRARR